MTVLDERGHAEGHPALVDRRRAHEVADDIRHVVERRAHGLSCGARRQCRRRDDAARGGQQLSAFRPHTIVIPWFFSGNERMRLPVAAKYAFSTAGAATQIVGSPTPPQNPPDG